MNFYQKVSKILGNAQVQVEGFFTERVINLCKFNNIKIWNIQNITGAMVRFNISISEFKKLKKIVKKCKCSVKVIKKQGVYFKAFKYRKRKFVLVLLLLLIIGINIFNKFIWNIQIYGNNAIDSNYILEIAKKSGIYIGKFKPRIDINNCLKNIKKDIPNVAWIGIDWKGTTAIIRVVEKTTIPEEIIYDVSKYGDIIADKSGVITKIIAENGTALHSEGSYVESGMKLIEGVIHSEILGDYKVRASGIINMNVEHIFEKEYNYCSKTKEYMGKKKYSVGFSLNDKEIYINYLNKQVKYDKLKTSSSFKLLNNKISLNFYEFKEFQDIYQNYTYEQLLQKVRYEKDEYIKLIISNSDSRYVSECEEIVKTDTGIKYKNTIILNEKVGEFKGEVNG